MGFFSKLFGGSGPACSSCGKPVTHISIDMVGKNVNGVRCKGCGQTYCLFCKNVARELMKCDGCGGDQFSFLVDGKLP